VLFALAVRNILYTFAATIKQAENETHHGAGRDSNHHVFSV
jgi:hypothetical protein